MRHIILVSMLFMHFSFGSSSEQEEQLVGQSQTNLQKVKAQEIYVTYIPRGRHAQYHNTKPTLIPLSLELKPDHLLLTVRLNKRNLQFEITEEQAVKMLAGNNVEIKSISGNTTKHIQKNPEYGNKLIYQ